MQVPHWERILLIAARSCDMTGLGHIGADVVIDEQRGPLLLELNARPGIQIQVANNACHLSGRHESIWLLRMLSHPRRAGLRGRSRPFHIDID